MSISLLMYSTLKEKTGCMITKTKMFRLPKVFLEILNFCAQNIFSYFFINTIIIIIIIIISSEFFTPALADGLSMESQ